MNILRQLLRDTQEVLRDMSTTQRVVLVFLIASAAGWLAFASWLGATSETGGRRVLPVEVDPGDSANVLAKLTAKGIETAEYDIASRRFTVAAVEERKAVITMAEEKLLFGAHHFGFEQMLDKWSFSDTRMKSEAAKLLARSNEVAKLIESLTPIREAKVIYSDPLTRTLFGPSYKKTAAVQVRTKLGHTLDEGIAAAIISLVAAAKSGLNPADVMVTDQHGTIHTLTDNTPAFQARKKWEWEKHLNDRLGSDLTALLRQYVPNIEEEGEIVVIPHHEVNFDYQETAFTETLPGEPSNISTHKVSSNSHRKPPAPPGLVTNAVRAANQDIIGSNSEESSYDEKVIEKTMQNSRRETLTKMAPKVTNLTIAAIIRLPYRHKRGEDGQKIQARDDMDNPLIDPVTRQPLWERESMPALPQAVLDVMKRQIAAAANIPPADIPEKISLSQVTWSPPIRTPVGGPNLVVEVFQAISDNLSKGVTLAIFGIVVWIAYRFAARPIPAETVTELGEVALALALNASPAEDEYTDEEWESLRSKVVNSVREEPQRAARVLKRWLRKSE